MFGCQQIRLHPDPETLALLEFVCSEAVKLSNCAIYLNRQTYFKTGKLLSKFDLVKAMGSNIHFSAMCAQAAQQALISVGESFRSFTGLLKGIKGGSVTQKPKLPGYRQGGLMVITYPSQAVTLKPEGLRFPLGQQIKAWFGVDCFYLPMPTNLDFKAIREYRILPRNGCFYLELVYKVESVQADVDFSKFLGIDHGMNNWLTCISNVGTSFIVDGLKLKSLNQGYNKRVAFLMGDKPNGFWSKRLESLTEKRNRQMRDAVNKAARIVINHCMENNIGTIIFGWNVGQKNGANMGKKTNQKFVQIPTARLKARIAQLCEQYGLKFEETEESYTSKTSFVDADFLPKYGEKPMQWRASGRRIERGLYRTANGLLINADCNGAANIARKVATKLGLDLSGVSRGALMAPVKIRFWI